LFVFIGLVNSKLIQYHLINNATISKSNLKPVLRRSFFIQLQPFRTHWKMSKQIFEKMHAML